MLMKLKNLLTAASIYILIAFLSLLLFSSVSFTSQPTQMFTIFDEVWQIVNDNFYDSQFNGVDWKAMRKRYEPLLNQTKSLEEVSIVINRMLSELKTSHTQFYTKLDPEYYQILDIFNQTDYFAEQIKEIFPNRNIEYTGIGISTKNINGKAFIEAVMDDSPAAKAGLKVGDKILSVDGKNYYSVKSFIDKFNQKVQISIQRQPDENSIETITVIPKKINPNIAFLEAMKASVEIIERDDKKIGYIHIWSYAGEQYQQLLSDEIRFGKLKEADGLILDLRDGWGGANPDYLNIFSTKVPVLTRISRDGEKSTLDSQWRKPVVMVVNNKTRSGKEILAYGFKRFGIGTVIGTKTSGAVVAGGPFFLSDGSLLYLAVSDILVDGERLEGKGVTPDIEVPFQLEYAQGQDPQKERAVEVLVAAIGTSKE